VLEEVVASGEAGAFFGFSTFSIFGCAFFGVVVAVVVAPARSDIAGVDVETTSGVDVPVDGVVEAESKVVLAACGELVEAVDVAAPKTLPPVAATPETEGRENGCNRVSQLLPDAATTA